MNTKKQHTEILEAIKTIEKIISAKNVAEEAFALSMSLAKLSGSLVIHLRSEDDVVYPKLKNSPDKNIKETAEKFIAEMGDLAETFKAYKTKYISAQYIRAHADDFIKETNVIFSALKNRIQKEENYLYPLLNK